jgi:predicted transcriptional regulator
MNLRVKPALKAKLEKLAKEDRRTLSAYVEKLLEDYVNSALQVDVERQQKTKKRRAV